MDRAEWRALKVMADLVNHYCYEAELNAIDTIALSANFRAVRILAEHRLIEIEHEDGRRVIGMWTHAGFSKPTGNSEDGRTS